MNTESAFANLRDASAVLGRLRIRPFLADGTLLGAVREGDFLVHDLDTDMGVFIEEWDHRPATLALISAGFSIRRVFGRKDLGLEVSLRRLGVKLDLFMYYEAPGVRYHAAWPKGEPPIRYDYEAFRLAPLKFRGRAFFAPADPVRFLEQKYGADWRVPVTPWDWRWGPKNARAWPTVVT